MSVGLLRTKACAHARNSPTGIGILRNHQGSEIEPIIVGVAERIKDCRGRNIKDWPRNRIEVDLCGAFDHESVCHGLKTRRRNGVAEDILRQSYRCGWCHHHVIRNEAKLVAPVWPQHQTMETETDRHPVAVGRLVMERESYQKSTDKELHD